MVKLFFSHPVPIFFTKQGYVVVVAERDKLLTERPGAVANLKEAREMGDLSENGYYKEARARLSRIDGRLRHLEKLIKRAKILKYDQKGKVQIGCSVKLEKEGKVITYTIVGTEESNPAKGTISYQSPIGKMLMGKKKGDIVEAETPSGKFIFKILNIQ